MAVEAVAVATAIKGSGTPERKLEALAPSFLEPKSMDTVAALRQHEGAHNISVLVRYQDVSVEDVMHVVRDNDLSRELPREPGIT